MYNLNDLQPVDEFSTGMNPGFMAVCGEKAPIVAAPGEVTGSLFIKNYSTNEAKVLTGLHENAIQLATFNHNASLVATCSEKGTLIRIWDA